MAFRVAAVQLTSGPDAIARLTTLVARLAQDGATLVAVPPWAGESADMPASLCALARQCNVWLAGGSTLIQQDGQRYRAAWIIQPDGVIAREQRQTHRTPEERHQGLGRGEDLQVVTTPVGPVGLVVGADVLYPEVSRIITLLGATVLVHPTAMPPASERAWMARLWREVQANQVYALEAPLLGPGLGGRATIHAPLEMTEDRRGILAQAEGSGDDAVMAPIDMDRLAQVWQDYDIFAQFNYALYQRMFPGVYGNG